MRESLVVLLEQREQLLATQTALNIVWTILAACLVMFMQTGFALVETGFSRSKNVAHTMAMNFLVYSIGVLAYWACGFALQMGGAPEITSLGQTAGMAREVSVVLMLRQGTEVEVKLPGRFKVSPQIAGAIKAVPGVVQVEAV